MASELDALVAKILASKEVFSSRQRTALFKYLWDNRDRVSPAIDIWEGALHPVSTSKDKDEAHYNYESTVRQSYRELKMALQRYFAGFTQGWYFDLPPAERGAGYRLEIVKLNDPDSATMAFWKAHLYPPRNVAVAYTEDLFFQDWPERLTFRYGDLNEERETRALDDLHERHAAMYKEGLTVAYPYVAAGDIEARDLFIDWFERNALVKVQKAITRRMDDQAIAESSLILLGSVGSNRLMSDILNHRSSQHLAFRLQAGGVGGNGRRFNRVTIKGTPQELTEEERQRLAPYQPVRVGANYHIDFTPDEGAELAILSRVANPYVEAAVTMFNAESGRAVEQLARLVTDEDRLYKAIGEYNSAQVARGHAIWPNPLPASFEILYAVPIDSLARGHRRASLEPLAWRYY
jgi:hypothetical protein